MARYAALLGKRVEVQYRAADIFLPAAGKLVADSGKSIFLEEHSRSSGSVKTFRWEIPYPYIIRIEELPEPDQMQTVSASLTTPEAADPVVKVLPLKGQPQES
jgi:hypothetical protein